MSTELNQSPVLMILGPTASGKSAAAMALAQQYPIEIITVDSAQVYRNLDIGTAKPTAQERTAVPHHLIDIVDPSDRYSAARFAQDATELMKQIQARNRRPVFVGGTMLYVKALTEGLHQLPVADSKLREQLEHDAAQHGWPALHARLAGLDPITSARLKPTDSQRIQRALEICLLSNQPMSELLKQPRPRGPAAGIQFLKIALEPSDRSVLHQRISQRFEQMLKDGLIEEVQALRARADLHSALPAIRCVGYRQVWAWLQAGGKTQDRNAMIDAGIAATRQLAKRQLTWLRSMPERRSLDCLAPDCAEQITAIASET